MSGVVITLAHRRNSEEKNVSEQSWDFSQVGEQFGKKQIEEVSSGSGKRNFNGLKRWQTLKCIYPSEERRNIPLKIQAKLREDKLVTD